MTAHIDDRGRKVHATDSIRVLSLVNIDTVPDLVNRRWTTQFEPGYASDTPRLCFLAMLSSSENTGIDTIVSYMGMGEELGRKYVETYAGSCNNLLDDSIGFLEDADICTISINPENGSVFDIIMPTDIDCKATRLIGGLVASYLRYILSVIHDKRLEICSMDVLGNSSIQATIGEGASIFPPNNKLSNIIEESPRDGWPAIYLSDRGAVYVNGTQAHMLDILAQRCCSLAEMADLMGMPTSTTSFHLNRLGQYGLVDRTRNGFASKGYLCIRMCEPMKALSDEIRWYLGMAVTQPDDIHRHFLSYVITNTLWIGMDLRPILCNTARALAIKLCEYLEEVSFDSVLKHLNYNAWWFRDCTVEVHGLDPFTIVIRFGYRLSDTMADAMNRFYGSFFCEILHQLRRGDVFEISRNQIFGEGNRNHILTIVPHVRR